MPVLPEVDSLQQAVDRVIRSNKKDGYNPTRFAGMTDGGEAENLRDICEGLILRGDTTAMERFIEKGKAILAVEDFVVVHGERWGFAPDVIRAAQDRALYFDKLYGGRRYT